MWHPDGMTPFLSWLESTSLSVWTRESTSVFAFPAMLSAHAVGMALAAGFNGVLALHLLGAAPGIPGRELRRFVPIMWFGFWLNAVSGGVLLIGYPTKALTNPVFYLKLSLLALAMWIFTVLRRRVLREPDQVDAAAGGLLRVLAAASLICWAGVITSGRLLAYTYSRLLASW